MNLSTGKYMYTYTNLQAFGKCRSLETYIYTCTWNSPRHISGQYIHVYINVKSVELLNIK